MTARSKDPRGSSGPPKEPYNPAGLEQAPWALTNPLALLLFGFAVIGAGIYAAIQPMLGMIPNLSSSIAVVVFGLVMVALGAFAVRIAFRRARWYKELEDWKRANPNDPRAQ